MGIRDISYGRGLKMLGYATLFAATACADRLELKSFETPNVPGRSTEQVNKAKDHCLKETEGEFNERLRSIQDNYSKRENAALKASLLFPAAPYIEFQRASKQAESLNIAREEEVNECIDNYLEDD